MGISSGISPRPMKTTIDCQKRPWRSRRESDCTGKLRMEGNCRRFPYSKKPVGRPLPAVAIEFHADL